MSGVLEEDYSMAVKGKATESEELILESIRLDITERYRLTEVFQREEGAVKLTKTA